MDLNRSDRSRVDVKHRGGLVDFMRARPERVLEQWEAAERTSHGFAELFRDHVAEILLRVTAHMERGGRSCAETSLVEGIHVRGQPCEIASELARLRTSVFDAWIDDGGGPLDPEEVVRFGRALDAVLSAALAAWSDGVVRREVTTGETTRPNVSIIRAQKSATTSGEQRIVDTAEVVRLVGILGHELRTPLHAIAFSMAKLLEDHQIEDAVRSGMQKTARGAERMVDKIDDVLDFATVRLDGALPVSRKPHNVLDIARAVLEREDAAPGARRSRLRAAGDTTCICDKDRLAQTLTRLIANARRHGEAGAIDVTVRGESDHVELVVENPGELDAAAVDHLFQPFHAHAPARPTQRGLGLGLFLVDAVARAHGGAVSASSAGGRTTFVVRLPRSPW